jgi:hypothetical protein
MAADAPAKIGKIPGMSGARDDSINESQTPLKVRTE